MFKQWLGSPRNTQQPQQQGQQSGSMSILSPRNFMKYISDGISNIKNGSLTSPSQQNYKQFIATFNGYLGSIKKEHEKYHRTRIKEDHFKKNSKNQQLELQLKINKIPSIFFSETQFPLQLCRRNEVRKKQQELTDYLDEVEMVLFSKAGKYPQKSIVILDNINDLEEVTEVSTKKVIQWRKNMKEKVFIKQKKHDRICQLIKKSKRIKQMQNRIFACKKVINLKQIAENHERNYTIEEQQKLLNINKTQLNICDKINSLKKIVINIESYRESVKCNLFSEFVRQVSKKISSLLEYDKNQWQYLNIPNQMFSHKQDNLNNQSTLNITVLDQTYFGFNEQNQVPIKLNEDNSKHISEIWKVIKKYDFYDENQMNEHLERIIVKHNTLFNQDIGTYITEMNNQKHNKMQTYAEMKNRQNKTQQRDSSHDWCQLQLPHYLKICKFYFELIKKLINFINQESFQFLVNFQSNLFEFVQTRIEYFVQLRKSILESNETTVDEFTCYLGIMDYWLNQQDFEVHDFCLRLRHNKIQQYLTNIQKRLLVKELKTIIQNSKFMPVKVSSDVYMTFYYIFLKKNPIGQDFQQEIQMSIMEDQKEPQDSTQFRFINDKIYYNSKIYKVCDSFILLMKEIQRYLRLKQYLSPEFDSNIEQKVCQIVGFYVWYNQKVLTNPKSGTKTLKNLCTFYSSFLLLKQIFTGLLIKSKKVDKTNAQLSECEKQISKKIELTPFLLIEDKIANLYQSKISTRTQIPTLQSQKILDIIKISLDCFKDYFPIDNQNYYQNEVTRFLQKTIKLIAKNYYGFLSTCEKRGLDELRWFLPRLKALAEVTFLDKEKGSFTIFLFEKQINEMWKILK